MFWFDAGIGAHRESWASRMDARTLSGWDGLWLGRRQIGFTAEPVDQLFDGTRQHTGHQHEVGFQAEHRIIIVVGLSGLIEHVIAETQRLEGLNRTGIPGGSKP